MGTKKMPRREVLRAGALLVAVAGSSSSGMDWGVARARAAGSTHDELLVGVNVAGAEFGENIPGVYGTDYTYPMRAGLERYRAMGFNVVRLPFRWERLQRDVFGEFNEDEWRRLSATILQAGSLGLTVIIDPHNYARRRVREDNYSTEYVIGSREVPVDAFLHFWRELVRRTKNWPRIIYGLMNEPYAMDANVWFEIAQKSVLAIRDEGSSNLVLVPGTAWTGAHSWHEVGNTIIGDLSDPAKNFAIEVHQYLDDDSSGSTGQTTSMGAGVQRITRFQTWARSKGLKAFLGEFAGGNDARGVEAVRRLLNEIDANRDVWIGWTWWAGGPWWPDDFPFNIEPMAGGESRPQAQLLSTIARSHASTK